MSASRRFRKRLSTAQAHALLAAAEKAEPVFLRTFGGQEAWMRGEVMFIIPALKDGMPPELANAIDRRRRAALTGRCDCGARRHIKIREGLGTNVIAHEHHCIAGDEVLTALAERLGWKLGWAA